ARFPARRLWPRTPPPKCEAVLLPLRSVRGASGRASAARISARTLNPWDFSPQLGPVHQTNFGALAQARWPRAVEKLARRCRFVNRLVVLPGAELLLAINPGCSNPAEMNVR